LPNKTKNIKQKVSDFIEAILKMVHPIGAVGWRKRRNKSGGFTCDQTLYHATLLVDGDVFSFGGMLQI
jgi:hypothetical protein